MTNIQINLRAPVTAKDVVQDVCTRLRNDPRFEERLRRWLSYEGANADQDVRDAIEDLQHRVRMLEATLGVTKAGQTRIKHEIERGKPDRQIAADNGVPVEIVAYLRRGMGATEATEAPAAALETGDRRDLLETADSGHAGAGEAYTYKSGNRTFVTKAGEAKIREMKAAGHTAYNIAKVLGISGQGVRYRLQKMGLNDRNE
jgi:hypothetical protein